MIRRTARTLPGSRHEGSSVQSSHSKITSNAKRQVRATLHHSSSCKQLLQGRTAGVMCEGAENEVLHIVPITALRHTFFRKRRYRQKKLKRLDTQRTFDQPLELCLSLQHAQHHTTTEHPTLYPAPSPAAQQRTPEPRDAHRVWSSATVNSRAKHCNEECTLQGKGKTHVDIHMCRPTFFILSINNEHKEIVAFAFCLDGVPPESLCENLYSCACAIFFFLRQLPSRNPQIFVTSDQTKSSVRPRAPFSGQASASLLFSRKM